MAMLSLRLMNDVIKAVGRVYGDGALRFCDLSGAPLASDDPLAVLNNTRRRRSYAMQESISLARPHVFMAAPNVAVWVTALENQRMIHGSMVGGDVWVGAEGETKTTALDYMVAHGMRAGDAAEYLHSLPSWPEERVAESAADAQRIFYEMSGWRHDLMTENRRRILQQEQLARSIEDQRGQGGGLYAFEKERLLLANIRAGDRNSARRLLNEMLATIYMSSPELVVLRARAVELMSCLTRAAIEDNHLMEPLIERNHRWTERLIRSGTFEDLSAILMEALDEFVDDIYLHGVNRSNVHVHKAIEYISGNYMNEISLSVVAAHVGLSGYRLAHLVKDYTGQTVHRIIRQVRIAHAKQLLERSELSCAEIAYEVGFGDQSYFTKHFRRSAGTTPARYRRAHAGQTRGTSNVTKT